MDWQLIILVGSQILFTISDLLARHSLLKTGFNVGSFLTGWFLFYTLIRVLATFGQLYVFSQVELGRAVAIFGAVSIILSNVLALLVLKEVLSVNAYIGVALAIIAFFILAMK